MTCSPCTISREAKSPDLNKAAGCAFAMFLAATLTACGEEPARLPALGVDLSGVSVSGLSSGAYMAGQFHLAHSDLVSGAGLVGGGPYGCAESVFASMTPLWPAALAQNLNRALNGCMKTSMAALGVPDTDRLAARARARAGDGVIDSLDGLKGDRVYLFAGKADRTVSPSLAKKTAELYGKLGAAKEDIALVDTLEAGHGFLTTDEGAGCAATQAPFINDCDYDQAGAILKHIYGALKPPAAETKGSLLLFAQDEFSGEGLDGLGAVFIPESCMQTKGCRVHVAFHGCRQTRAEAGNAFIEKAGYNRWASANRLIVLYPQADDSAANPRGCWDWWGYTGPKFLTRDAPQIRAVRAMLARLAAEPAG